MSRSTQTVPPVSVTDKRVDTARKGPGFLGGALVSTHVQIWRAKELKVWFGGRGGRENFYLSLPNAMERAYSGVLGGDHTVAQPSMVEGTALDVPIVTVMHCPLHRLQGLGDQLLGPFWNGHYLG